MLVAVVATVTAAVLPCFRCYICTCVCMIWPFAIYNSTTRLYGFMQQQSSTNKSASIGICCLLKQELIFTQHHFLLLWFHIPWNHGLDMKHQRNQYYHHIQYNVLSIVWILYGMIPIVNNCILLFLKFKCDNRKNIYFDVISV